MLILGIDPGTATTGWGLIKFTDGDFEIISWGLIETSKDEEPTARLKQIFDFLNEILEKTKPEQIAMEKVFFSSNAKTVIRVGQAQGVIMLSSSLAQIPFFEYAPQTIKKILTGSGRADKKLVQQKLRELFGAKIRSAKHKKTHFDNAADALAIAYCHAKTLKV